VVGADHVDVVPGQGLPQRLLSSAWASVSIMKVRKQSTEEARSIVSLAVSKEWENRTTSSAWTNSLKGRVPSRVLGPGCPRW
jgi:hypothetical protein